MISDATERSILRSIRFYDNGQFEAQHGVRRSPPGGR
jgi:hypothetical protein